MNIEYQDLLFNRFSKTKEIFQFDHRLNLSERKTNPIFVIKSYFYEYKVQPTLDALKIKINAIKSDLLKTSIIDELREVMKYVEAPVGVQLEVSNDNVVGEFPSFLK